MVILGLGSNVGDREEHLRDAVALLRAEFADVRCSSVYESHALLPEGAPEGWDMPFLNVAVGAATDVKPHAVLALTQGMERKLGRVDRGRWGPREIDIDILAYGDYEVADATLVIPHRELLKRAFALIPLAELAPGWAHPKGGGKTAGELAAEMAPTLKKTDIVIA